jgi:DNA-binding CsgD family transcriptional regulator
MSRHEQSPERLDGLQTAEALTDRVTQRQLDVILAAARGLTARESAQLLGISYRTVESHRLAAYRRLGVHSALGAIPILLSAGMLGSDTTNVA